MNQQFSPLGVTRSTFLIFYIIQIIICLGSFFCISLFSQIFYLYLWAVINMSFADRIGSLLRHPNDDLVAKYGGVPPWMKYLARGIGTLAGGVGLFFGVFNVLSNLILHNLIGSMIALWVSFSVLTLEAPFCWVFINFIHDASNWMDSRPHWNKAAYYMIGAAIPNLLAPSVFMLLGLLLVFVTGLIYGMMALEKTGAEEICNNTGSNKQQVCPASVC